MSVEELMRLRCDSPRCQGSIERPRSEREPDGVRAAAAASGWTVVGGAASLAHHILTRDMSPQDRCPACNRGRSVAFAGSCPHCDGMGPIGGSDCLDCGQAGLGAVPARGDQSGVSDRAE